MASLVSVMWAGGWDEYEIDPTTSRAQTPEEVAQEQDRIQKGWGGTPEIGFREWLRPHFIHPASDRPDVPEGHVVKILRYVRGGD